MTAVSSLYDEELVKSHYHPTVVFYYFKQWDDFQMPFHSHRQVEIMYVISGQCIVETGEEAILMKKGQFIVIDAYVAHRLLVEKGKPCRMLNVEFIFEEKQGSFPSIREMAKESEAFQTLLEWKKPYFLLHDPNDVYQTLKKLVLELDKNNNKLMVQLLFSQLIIHVSQLAPVTEEEDSRTNTYVKKTVDYMHHNYDCPIQVKDISESVHLHPNYLQRIFKKEMGCSIMDYLTRFRMEKAKMLLLQSDIPITEISEYIGINSRQYFSTTFKRYTGLSPLEFRSNSEKWNHRVEKPISQNSLHHFY